MRLSSTQRAVLEAMNDGSEICFYGVSIPKVRYSLFDNMGRIGDSVSPATFCALLQCNYIDLAAGGVCKITDAGRAVLAEVTT